MDPITEQDVLAALPANDASFLTRYVNLYAQKMTDAHNSYHLLAGLAALAQTCPIDFSFPFGSPMYSNIYGLCVGRSSDARKSASINIIRDVVDRALPGSIGEVPGSKEHLVDSLKANPRQLIMYPEFGSFLSQAVSGYMNPLKTAYTEAWDGTPLGRGLVKKKDTEARYPRLSMLAASTIEYLERHTELSDWTGGFMARFICMYAERDRTFTVPPGKPEYLPALVEHLQYLAAYANFGVPRGQCLGFSSDARVIWDDWYETSLKGRFVTEETAGLVARSHAHALRVAMLLAWDYGQARYGTDWYVTADVLLPAIRIIGLHLRSVQRIGANLSGSRDMRDRRAVLNCIRATPTSLGEIISNSRLLKRRVTEIIESLAEEGLITSHVDGTARGQQFMLKPKEEVQVFDVNAAPPSNVIQLFPQPTSPGSNTTGSGEAAASGAGASPNITNSSGVGLYGSLDSGGNAGTPRMWDGTDSDGTLTLDADGIARFDS